ncbi:spore coat protein [Azospirillum cavernae]|uniref:Spore coat protein n=1 Tax=Azospirillum cavernae TaxID=2320860 RepID=A0A418VKY6_9PROT|nr:NTP transferase domain-containing protein [Azospirillum cavernae]RJF76810.1 spore coat protein [Azospirillum cavernae]
MTIMIALEGTAALSGPVECVPLRIFVQARMSSRRLPGKVLAPFRSKPMIAHVLRAATQALPGDGKVVVITSDDVTDDPLALYVEHLGFPVFRGPLDDVLSRFRQAAVAFPCAWMLRISADSPLIDPQVIAAVAARCDFDGDLVTNIFPRSFPKGQSAELIRTASLNALSDHALTTDDREHVTPYFYRNPKDFRILNIRLGADLSSSASHTVDTLDDLRRLEGAGDVSIALEDIWEERS